MINPQAFSLTAITIDLDWAPDFAIRFAAAILLKHKVKATWFVTHDSPAVQELKNYSDYFEIGIHPNFMPGSTQGKTNGEVLNNLLQIVPSAKSVRTHGLFQSSDIMREMAIDFGLETDVSIFLWRTPYIVPSSLNFTQTNLVRTPYFWAEEEEMGMSSPFVLGRKYRDWIGMKIFNFHPIHIYLNSASTVSYQRLKRKVSIQICKESEAFSLVNHGIGCGSFFKELVEQLSNEQSSLTISEIANRFRKEIKNNGAFLVFEK